MKLGTGEKRLEKSTGRARITLAATIALFIVLSIAVSGVQAGSRNPRSKPLTGIVNRLSADGEHYLGLKPSPPGDYPRVTIPAGEMGVPFRSSVDLSSELPPVDSQGRQGSCAAWATSYYYKSWLEKQEHPGWDLNKPWYQYSPSFVYNQVNHGVDEGSNFQDIFLLLEAKGDVDIAEMPYSDKDFGTQPNDSQLNAAKPYVIDGWSGFWVNTVSGPYDPPNPIDDIKRWLNSGKGLVMGMPVNDDFPGRGGNPANPYYDYDGVSELLGGHGVCVCGYDDNINPGGADPDHRGGFKMVNSWGPTWNGTSRGFVYLSYDFVKRYVWEAWAMTDSAPDSPIIDSIDPAPGHAGDTVTIKGKNFGTDRRASRVTFPGNTAAETVSWNNNRIKARVPATALTGSVNVYDWEGGSSNSFDFNVISNVWYLAEGSTALGFETYMTIENPNAEDLNAAVTYMLEDGVSKKVQVGLPAYSQTTVNPRDHVGHADFSTRVECVQGKAIAVDRTMTWRGPGAPSEEAHSSVGVTFPAKTWYLPEGSTAWGFECFLLIQNPGAREARCRVTYMTEKAGPISIVKKVPAGSRKTINVKDDIGEQNASIEVKSDLPVVPERAMYRNNRREGHDSIGTTLPATDYYLAEGTTAWGYDTYVLVQNPNNSRAEITITYMTPLGPLTQGAFTMRANSRKTIKVNNVLPNTDLSTRVHGSKPIVAERAMYWGEGAPLGEACHDSIGVPAAHMRFFLPDGQTSDGRQTWILVQNPNSTDVSVEISCLTPSGQAYSSFTEIVPANSRKTFNMKDKAREGRVAAMVTSRTPGGKIIAERSMYWNTKGAGTNTIGGYSD